MLGLKPSFSANPSRRSLPFLQDSLHAFSRLYTDTSEHTDIRFFLFPTF